MRPLAAVIAAIALCAAAAAAAAASAGTATAAASGERDAKHFLLLAYPGGNSHYFACVRLAEEAIARGHKVTIVATQFDVNRHERPGRATPYTVLSYASPYSYEAFVVMIDSLCRMDGATSLKTLFDWLRPMTHSLFRNATIGKYVEDNIDLVLIDSAMGLAGVFADLYKTPRIYYSPILFYDPFFGASTAQGTPQPVSRIPMLDVNAHPPFTFGERVKNMILYVVYMKLGLPEVLKVLDEFTDEYVVPKHGKPANYALEDTVMAIPTIWGLEPPRSLPPNLRVVGPLMPTPAAPLPADLAAYIEGAGSAGVLLVSLGTLSIYTNDMFERYAAAFGQLAPMRVLWKVNNNEMKKKVPANVRLSTWLPQNDVLGHGGVTVFLTHCGANSLMESVYHGIPMIGAPMFADQRDNAQRILYADIGVTIDGLAVVVSEVVAAVRKVASNASFRANAERLGRIAKRTNAISDIIDLAEEELAIGHAHLIDHDQRKMSFVVRHSLDVITFLGAIVAAFAALVALALRACVRAAARRLGGSAKHAKRE